jgi:hypothetical protein
VGTVEGAVVAVLVVPELAGAVEEESVGEGVLVADVVASDELAGEGFTAGA